MHSMEQRVGIENTQEEHTPKRTHPKKNTPLEEHIKRKTQPKKNKHQEEHTLEDVVRKTSTKLCVSLNS